MKTSLSSIYHHLSQCFRESIVLVFFVFLSGISFSQSQQQWLKHANASFQEKDYYGAAIYYREAMLVDSSNLFVVYRYAESLRQIHNYKLAEQYYKYVFLKDRARSYQESLFWLATMQKNNAKYVDARKNFMTFNKSFKDKNSFYSKKSAQEIKSCEFALSLINSPGNVKPWNAGDSINSTNAEFAAVRKNDSVILFSSLQYAQGKEKEIVKSKKEFTSIYTATIPDTIWIRKEKLDTTINQENTHNANGSFSPDGSTFYFSRCDAGFHCAIYESKIINGIFQTPTVLPAPINIEGYTNTQPFVTRIDTNDVLYFVSNRPGGSGGLDIWISIKSNGLFKEVYNVGSPVNTIEDDISPYFDPDSNHLYFSSPWHYGLGGFDIFKCKGKPGSFSEPQNLGYPINSSANDFYFSIDTSAAGFLTSNRIGSYTKENETCCNDLWIYQMPKLIPRDTITPIVKINPLKELRKFIPIKLYFHNDEPNPKSRDTISTISYTQAYNDYINLLETYKQNYSDGLSEEKKKIAEDSMQSFFTNQVQYNYNQLQEFTAILLRQLEKGYNLELSVKGHASPLAKTDYNVNLTHRRISSLEKYLMEYENGIFVPYLIDSASNGGSLKIVHIPFGEYKAERYISDNLNDKKSSVYSVEAALNRNIELISVSLERKDSIASRMFLKKNIYDFKELKQNQQVKHTFKFTNTGNASLIITDTSSTCACLTAQYPTEPIAPGSSGLIIVSFDSGVEKGKIVQTITFTTNGIPEKRELTITAEVKD